MNKQELLKKLKALAEHGVGGEKENAQKLLEKFMRKYNISEDDIDDDRIIKYSKKVKNDYEKQLLVQTVYKVTNGDAYSFRYIATGRKIKNLVGYECTAAQNIEIEFLFDFYKRLFYKEIDLLLNAFIQKHDIFGTPPEDSSSPDEMDLERISRLIQMMSVLSDETPQLQIESRKKA